MKAWRFFFLAAGLYNVVGGAVGVVTAPRQFALQLLLIMVVIMGIGYLMVAHDPLGNRGVVWIGLLTKVAGFTMSFVAIHTDQLPASSWWHPMVNDLPWAVGFTVFLLRTRSPSPGESP